MSSALAELLFKDYRRRVLGLLLLHPEKKFHVREIARLTGTVAGTLHKELTRLAEAGLLARETVGNQIRYGANRECPIYEELAGILRKTSGLVDVLADALAPLAEKIESAFVFGSMARGTETAGSDVDIMVIGDVRFSEVVKALHGAQGILRREINPKVYGKAEWRRMNEKKDAFVKEVTAKPKLYIIGSAHEPG
ncbi:MAG: DNA polymerase subunit beta [Gammaproteobacteria bacterium RBG_16_57_12]|nr:MAG: DNA polymerase subunit beta [Gammaproteobacteria bacterium RBG_16_57_12]